MQITLAYPYGDHQPDETVDLPDDEARRLLNDGFARLPGSEPIPEATFVDDDESNAARVTEAEAAAAASAAADAATAEAVARIEVEAPTTAEVKAYARKNQVSYQDAAQALLDEAQTRAASQSEAPADGDDSKES